jgi:hypothetical protein
VQAASASSTIKLPTVRVCVPYVIVMSCEPRGEWCCSQAPFCREPFAFFSAAEAGAVVCTLIVTGKAVEAWRRRHGLSGPAPTNPTTLTAQTAPAAGSESAPTAMAAVGGQGMGGKGGASVTKAVAEANKKKQ